MLIIELAAVGVLEAGELDGLSETVVGTFDDGLSVLTMVEAITVDTAAAVVLADTPVPKGTI